MHLIDVFYCLSRLASLREQQVKRLRQEIMHPSGVRLTLRKRDCQNSLGLIEMFGCVWVAGWKHREFPVLYNAFHVGDQILTVAGNAIKTVSEFNKLVKRGSSSSSSSGQQSSSGSGQAQASSNDSRQVLNATANAPCQADESPRVEVIVRRLPFAQVFHLKREMDSQQPLGKA